ncbi:MAG: radical SAM protein [Nanoarchaeota archaeon]|nr:radical SAM protein [Nanoarchaeota archaeon]
MKKRIILIQPGVSQSFGCKYLPISLMPIAGYLQKKGFNVEIFDARHESYEKLNLNNVLFVGLTVLTGSQIKHALEIAEYIRGKEPKIPLVWGGIHPSLLPEQTAQNALVDVVVKGEGEITAYELAKAFLKQSSLNKIKGIVYKKNNEIIKTPDRPFMNLNDIPPYPYKLLNKSYYEAETIGLQTSRGCPGHCTYCFNMAYNKRFWRCKKAEAVLDEMKIAKTFWEKNFFAICDDNFFVDQNRVQKVAEGIIERKLNINWSGMCRADYINRWSDDFIKLLKKSGLKNLGIGGESGSKRILEYIQKGVKPEDTLSAVKKCEAHGIRPIVSFMCGFPGETKEDVKKTISLIDACMKSSRLFETNGIFLFTPYPGTPMFEDAVNLGFKEPKSMEEWGDKYFGDQAYIPWYSKKYRKYLQSVSTMGWLLFTKPNCQLEWKLAYFLKFILRALLFIDVRLRWKFKFFVFPIELRAYENYMRRYR